MLRMCSLQRAVTEVYRYPPVAGKSRQKFFVRRPDYLLTWHSEVMYTNIHTNITRKRSMLASRSPFARITTGSLWNLGGNCRELQHVPQNA